MRCRCGPIQAQWVGLWHNVTKLCNVRPTTRRGVPFPDKKPLRNKLIAHKTDTQQKGVRRVVTSVGATCTTWPVTVAAHARDFRAFRVVFRGRINTARKTWTHSPTFLGYAPVCSDKAFAVNNHLCFGAGLTGGQVYCSGVDIVAIGTCSSDRL